MISYVLVISSYPPDKLREVFKVSLETRKKYPDYIEKVMDAGENYTNYTEYKCADEKLADMGKYVGMRDHKIAEADPGYTFEVITMLATENWMQLIK